MNTDESPFATVDRSPRPDEPSGRFGTFGGVFTPSVLTILGVVMYMRLGFVTGQAGLGQALLIIAVAHMISLATGLSVASIATDRKVGAGGAYYMISRSLGAPAGAAIGLPLFFAQAISVTFYIVGFVESLSLLAPVLKNPLWFFAVGTGVNLTITLLSMKSAELAIRTQYIVMAAIGLSIISFFTGTTSDFGHAIEWTNPSGESFASIFADFFPAVTGIMAGVSMSGDLKDPRKSLPRGTLMAIGTGFVIYMIFPVWFAMNMRNEDLIANKEAAVFMIASVPALIYVGVWGATLSSAIGSVLTAPRTLQALAADGVAPGVFAREYGPGKEPRIGIALTFVMAEIALVFGSLDAIAPVLTMFFLATYGFTNLACGLQRWASSPSFRPTFRLPAPVSLLGAVACFYVMSIIHLPAMMGAMVFSAAIFLWMQGRAIETTYGDARHGIWSAMVRSSLQRLRRAPFHPLNWRPNLVILGGDPDKRSHLLHLGSAVVQDRGLVTYFQLLRGKIAALAAQRKTALGKVEPMIERKFPNVFFRVDIVDDIYKGAVTIAQSYGMGSFEANTVMIGWPRKLERAEPYVRMLRDMTSLDRSLLLVRYDPELRFGKRKKIQVWWGGLQGNGGLMLLVSFLIRAHHRWRGAEVSVITIVRNEQEQTEATANLERILKESRIEALPRVLLRGERSIPSIMEAEAKEADLAIVGFSLPDEVASSTDFFERMNGILDRLPTTLLVHSARGFDSDPLLFDAPAARPSAPPSPPQQAQMKAQRNSDQEGAA